jgi:hypothetical protein
MDRSSNWTSSAEAMLRASNWAKHMRHTERVESESGREAMDLRRYGRQRYAFSAKTVQRLLLECGRELIAQSICDDDPEDAEEVSEQKPAGDSNPLLEKFRHCSLIPSRVLSLGDGSDE